MSQNVKRKFTEEVKREAVKLIEEQGRTVADVARSLDVHRSQVDRWRQQFGKSEQVTGAGVTAPGDRKELTLRVILVVVLAASHGEEEALVAPVPGLMDKFALLPARAVTDRCLVLLAQQLGEVSHLDLDKVAMTTGVKQIE